MGTEWESGQNPACSDNLFHGRIRCCLRVRTDEAAGLSSGMTNGMENGIRPLAAADLEGFRALLLDFDGVLADSELLYHESWNVALSKWGVQIPEEEYLLHWTSLGEGLKGHLARHPDLEARVDPVEASSIQKSVYASFCGSGRIGLMDGAAGVLDELSTGAFAGRCAIASNTDESLIRSIIAAAGASPIPVVGGAGLPKKPMPDIFLRAASLLGSGPDETLVFEDAWKGLEAATRGGFRSVLVRSRLNRDFDLTAGYALEGIGALLPMLRELRR